MKLTALTVLLGLGCSETAQPAPPVAPTSAALAPAPPSVAPTSAAPASQVVEKASKPVVHAKPGPTIHWDGPVAWQSWDVGLAQATAEKKPILLLVYADWCPRCRELVPVFSDPEVVELAKGMVVIRQNGDEKPAWLAAFDTLGGYVPRVFFLTSNGSLREDLTSGNGRYPYFYTPSGIDALRTSMKAAIKG